MPVEQRLCDECNLIEDEFHVLMVCTRYIGIRTDAMNAISDIDDQFSTYTPHAQFISRVQLSLVLLLLLNSVVKTKEFGIKYKCPKVNCTII